MATNIKAYTAYNEIINHLKELKIKMRNERKRKKQKKTATRKQPMQVAEVPHDESPITSSTNWKIHGEPTESPSTVKTRQTIAMLIHGSLENLELASGAARCKATAIHDELQDGLKRDSVKIPVLVYHWFTKPTLKHVPVPLLLFCKPGREIQILLTLPFDAADSGSPTFPYCLWRESDQVDFDVITQYLATRIAQYCHHVHERFEYLTHN